MYHESDCCESVYLEDIVGDLDDLIDSPVLLAEEVVSENETPIGIPQPGCDESYTWTFYRIATRKGYVTLRWFGSSNGYYSESVAFVEVERKNDAVNASQSTQGRLGGKLSSSNKFCC